MIQTEYLSEDILEDNFVKIFSPFHVLQKIIGCSRVDARDRFISPPSFYQKLYSLMFAAVVFVLQSQPYKLICMYYEISPEVYHFYFFVICVQMSNFLCNLVHICFVNGNANSQLYIKLQEIDKLLMLDLNPELSAQQYRYNLKGVLFKVTIFMVMLLLSFYKDVSSSLIFFAIAYSEIPFALQLSHSAAMLEHFSLRIQFINGIMWNFIHGNCKKVVKYTNTFSISKQYVRNIGARTIKYEDCNIDDIFKHIFACFDIYRKLYRFQVHVRLV
jgi:hypothetical protein